MRTPKLLLTFCAASVCAGFISICAADNDTPEQAAARAALEQKMRESQGQSGMYFVPLTNATSGAVSQLPEKSAANPSIDNSPATGTISMQPKFSPVPPPSGDPAALAIARAALEQKMQESATNQTSAAFGSAFSQSEATKAANAAAQAKMQEMMQARQAAAAVARSRANTDKAVNLASKADYPGKDLGLKPMLPPPLPISAEKADKLATLLEKYKADAITPGEYQKMRAEILATP